MNRLHFNLSSVLRASNSSELYAVGNYAEYRDLCHRLKANDSLAIREAAALMASTMEFTAGSVLIPMPSHLGYSTNMLELADCISELTGVPVLDALQGNCRESLYDAKRLGHGLDASELGIRLKAEVPDDLRPLIIDNVVATGLTAGAALAVIPAASVFTLAIDTNKLMSR